MKANIIENIIKISMKCLEKRENANELKDLHPKDAEILLSIEKDETISSNELAKRNHLSPSRMSRIVDRLYKKGCISRQPLENDRRYSELSLTSKGTKRRDEMFLFNNTCEKELGSRMSEEEMATVKKAIIILNQALKKDLNGK